jgi:hypothetical protein
VAAELFVCNRFKVLLPYSEIALLLGRWAPKEKRRRKRKRKMSWELNYV